MTHRAGPALVWFRDDLRLADNPALQAAAGRPLVALFVHDQVSPGLRTPGAAQRWMLHRALAGLQSGLLRKGVRLLLLAGPAETVVGDVARRIGASAVFWNRRHGPAEPGIDGRIMSALRSRGVEVRSFLANLLHEPSTFLTAAGSHWRVFTPFWRALRAGDEPREPLPAPERLTPFECPFEGLALEDLGLLPTRPDWSGGLAEAWDGGEEDAERRAATFLRHRLKGYADGRDFPAAPNVSRLSPYLRFGTISPYRIWHDAGCSDAPAIDIAKFRAELGWREFSWHLLFHRPELARRNYSPRFDDFPWAAGGEQLRAWQRGQTGYPIVDAGMRQLWQTGWMHNRVRMIVASFLVKHLLIDWRRGEEWFWDTLVDGDPASNPANWQWVAGSGADAAPYFRIFNPVLQGERFDAHGEYVRRFVPEVARLPDRYLHAPWRAPEATLRAANVVLGSTYPQPLVDHETARARALHAFQALKRAD